MQRFEGGCESLRCDFRYNAGENTIEVTYSFTSTIPKYEGTVIVGEPHAHTLRYGRKKKGRKPAIDSIFDNPEKAAQITSEAEDLFNHELGWAISRAIQELVHEVLFRCGVEFKESPKQMADLLGSAHRKEIGKQLGVRPGRSRLFRDKNHYESTLQAAKERLLARGQRVTQAAVAETLAEMSSRFLNCDDRMVRQWNKEFGFDWRRFAAQVSSNRRN
jgi:hypothetical protein